MKIENGKDEWMILLSRFEYSFIPALVSRFGHLILVVFTPLPQA